MKKLIPILSLCVAAVTICIALAGIVTMSIAAKVNQVGFVAVPVAIVGGVLAAIGAPIDYMFKRDKLCLIAFYIQLCAFIISAVSVAIWLIAL